jgi:1-acyl-sn-glycerol-3-phosphate acyltransferase
VKPNFFMPITIRVSPPLTFEAHHHRATEPLVLRQVTDEIMFNLAALSGQEYVNHYAKKKDPDTSPAPESTPVLTGPSVLEYEPGGPTARPAAAVG